MIKDEAGYLIINTELQHTGFHLLVITNVNILVLGIIRSSEKFSGSASGCQRLVKL